MTDLQPSFGPDSLAGPTHNTPTYGVPPMKLAMRALALGSFLFVLAVAGVVAYPAWADDETDVWDLVEFRTRMAQSEAKGHTIDRENEHARLRIELKREVVSDLVAGRLTFEEAAQTFAEVNHMQPASTVYLRSVFPGNTDEERAQWQLVRFLHASQDPAAQALGKEWKRVLTARQ